jgi:hypothetical protein
LSPTCNPLVTFDPTPSIQCSKTIRIFLRIQSFLIQNRKQCLHQYLKEQELKIHPLPPFPPFTQPETSAPFSNTSLTRSSPTSSPQGSSINQGFREDLWDFKNNAKDSTDSDYQQTSTSKQFFKPARTASKGLKKYIEPENVEQFDTADGKVLRSGKVTFAKPITAKKWTDAAKYVLTHINKKPIQKVSQLVHLLKLLSAKFSHPIRPSVLNRMFSLPYSPTPAKK